MSALRGGVLRSAACGCADQHRGKVWHWLGMAVLTSRTVAAIKIDVEESDEQMDYIGG
jgi:hypothetical protein